jgi:hypothetical protein
MGVVSHAARKAIASKQIDSFILKGKRQTTASIINFLVASGKVEFIFYKKRSIIGPSFLIVAAGHNFRSVMIARSRA